MGEWGIKTWQRGHFLGGGWGGINEQIFGWWRASPLPPAFPLKLHERYLNFCEGKKFARRKLLLYVHLL